MHDLGSIAILDVALRGAAVSLFLVIAIATWRRADGRPAAWMGALLALGVAAYAICSAPSHPGYESVWFVPVLALCAGNTVVFWLFTRAAFDDSFRPAPWHSLVWLGLTACPLAALFDADFASTRPILFLRAAAPIVFVLLALVQTVKDWRSDLVEGRRRLRLFILAATTMHTAATVAVELTLAGESAPPLLHLLNACALVSIGAIVGALLLHANVESVLADPLPARAPSAGQPAPPEAAQGAPVDQALIAALDRLMTFDRLYRQEGLTIGLLAQRLGVPEHRLRRTINGGLGFRNFNEYLNLHRLADAKQALADPDQAEVSILTIALDSGFQSLGPFNRAFKADTGMTPSEFRRAMAARGRS